MQGKGRGKPLPREGGKRGLMDSGLRCPKTTCRPEGWWDLALAHRQLILTLHIAAQLLLLLRLC